MTEVLLQHQNGNQLFPFLVTELFYKRMGIADDGFCFFNMCTVVLNLVFQIGVIVLDFNVVDSRLQSPFHEPTFIFGTRHHGNRVGGHNPL